MTHVDYIQDLLPGLHSDINCQSKYYDIEGMCDVYNKHCNNLSIMYANSRSLPKHIGEYRSLLDCIFETGNIELDILCFVETWLNEQNGNVVHFDQYKHVSTKKPNSGRGGGISIFVKDHLDFHIREDLKFPEQFKDIYDCLFIEVHSSDPNIPSTLIGTMYRSPSHASETHFINSIEHLLNKLQPENKELIILGDFNIDLINMNTSACTMLDMFMNNQLFSQITVPTRVTETSNTLIDHVYKKVSSQKCLAGTLINDITDHYINFVFTSIVKHNPQQSKYVSYRSFTESNLNSFNNQLRQTDWSPVFDSNDPNDSYKIFYSLYKHALDKTIPLKTRKFNRLKHKKQGWMTRGILTSIKNKTKLYKIKKEATQDQAILTATRNYNLYRNTLNKIIRNAKRLHFQNLFEKSKNNMKTTWQNINKILQTKNKDRKFPSTFNYNGSSLSNKKDICNAFNDYYTRIGPSLAENITSNPAQTVNTMPQLNLRNSLFLAPTSSEEIGNIINKLKPKPSTGIDEISCKLIKQSDFVIIPVLTHIFNLSMETGNVPDDMKMAKVIPIYKNKDPNNLKNYRPISLLPSFSKILEKVMFKRLYGHFHENKLFFTSQYGFRQNHSTELAVTEFQDTIIKNIQKKLCSIGIFLDLSKAFDTLQHKILLEKLQHYGIRGLCLKWFENYLSDRQQIVNIDNFFSDKLQITCGVPQGSVLGPLLFLIYMNDLPNVSKLAKFVIFADDTNIVYSDSSLANLQVIANNDLRNINNWFEINKLSLNTEKTKFIVFDKKEKLRLHSLENLNVQLNNINIERVNETKFLGVILQDDLTWTSHIADKSKKISQISAILTRLKHDLPKQTLKTIYNALIEPHLTYGITAWASLPNSSIKRLQLIQKRTIRTISKGKYNCHTDPLFKSLKILKIVDCYQLKCSQLYHKKLKNLLPYYHELQLLTREEYIPNHTRTRQQNHIYIHSIKTNIEKRLLNYSVGMTWNKLPENIKSLSHLSPKSFSKHLKNYFLSQYVNICTIANCYICS